MQQHRQQIKIKKVKRNKIISFTSELNTVGFIDNNQTQALADFIWSDVRHVSWSCFNEFTVVYIRTQLEQPQRLKNIALENN